jgi:hypothetical protein
MKKLLIGGMAAAISFSSLSQAPIAHAASCAEMAALISQTEAAGMNPVALRQAYARECGPGGPPQNTGVPPALGGACALGGPC